MDKISALYVRVSTDEQAREGQSISTQIDKLMAYTKFQGWQNVQVFADEGESAKDMNRPEMKRLIALVKNRKVSVVATMAVDRLSRNLLDMLQFVELCENHGAAYVCASLNFDTSTPIGRMVLQILAAFAEFERAMIASRVKSNMFEIADKKKRYMAVPPFGYQYDEHRNLVVVPEEAEWVIKSADMFISGYGYRAVAKMLNETGIKTKKGSTWIASSVRAVLTNELYVGQLIWNRRFYDKEGKMHWRDPVDWIVRENAHPPILTLEQWDKINERITRKMPKGGERQAKYRLTGMLHCAFCGSKMASRRYGSKGPHKERYIFVCSDYQKNGRCRFNYIFIDEAEPAVYNVLQSLAEGMIDISDKDLNKAAESREQEFNRREASIDQKFQRQIQAYENGLISDRDLKIARDRIEKERALLVQERERANIPQKSDVIRFIQKEAKQLLWLWNNGDLPVIQNTMRTIFDRIIILEGKVVDTVLSEELFSPE